MESSNLKNIFSKDNFQKAVTFVKDHIRYFAAGALFIVLVLILVNFVGAKDNKDGQAVDGTEISSEVAVEEAYQVDAYAEINTLVSQYYSAYANGDADTLMTLALPITDSEKNYIAVFSQYVEGYQNIKCYTKSGLEEGSYLVSVSMEVKFTGVETAAPGLDFFYVRTNELGDLYIDNVYSQYNLANQENTLSVDVQTRINEFINETDVVSLHQEVQSQYDTALASDEALSTMVLTTLPNAISEWVSTLVAQSTEAPAEETPVEETPVEETPVEETPAEEPVVTIETLTATDRLNVRAAADASSDRIGTIEAGATVTRTGTEGEWSIIDYNGTTGYVMSEYLTSGSSSTDSNSGSLSEGTVVTLENTVNIRSGMSETSDRVGTAYAGEKVTVVMSYAEGWTKVTWDGKTGYIKTSLLQE